LGELFAGAGVFLFSGHLQTISDIEVARLNREAESANATAKAFERDISIAKASSETARRDAEAFRLDIAKANERAARAEERTAEANRKAEQERLAPLTIQEKMAP
jgi:hypothetical protein